MTSILLVQSYSGLVLLRPNHQLRSDILVKVLLTDSLQLHRRFLQGQSLLVSILGHFAGHVIPDLGIQAGYEHKSVGFQVSRVLAMDSGNHLRFLKNTRDPFLVRLQANHQILLKAPHSITQYSDAVQ
jgi:hypothetical protein